MTSKTPDNLVISDTSCLILLEKVGHLEVLRQLYKKVVTTSEVAHEFGLRLPDWIEVKEIKDKDTFSKLTQTLDLGESAALTLAYEIKECTIILDDLKARNAGIQLGLRVTGTIGILTKAKQNGFIDALKPVLEQVLATNFRISPNVIERALKDAGEV